MENGAEKTRLAVLWTTADRETVINVVLPYVKKAGQSGCFKTVRLAAWGPSVRVMSGYGDIARRIAELVNGGVDVIVDRACAEMYGAVQSLEQMGIGLTDMSTALTGMVCDGWQVLPL